MTQATAEQVRELLTQGGAGGARGAELTSEPTQQPYGIDFGLRDPFGNNVRIGRLTNVPAAPPQAYAPRASSCRRRPAA